MRVNNQFVPWLGPSSKIRFFLGSRRLECGCLLAATGFTLIQEKCTIEMNLSK
jgi:hypothetical protein